MVTDATINALTQYPCNAQSYTVNQGIVGHTTLLAKTVILLPSFIVNLFLYGNFGHVTQCSWPIGGVTQFTQYVV